MSQYLNIFAISPVQSFIAEARKSQDLYAGSQLLSGLMNEAGKILKEQDAKAIILYPYRLGEGDGKKDSFPNRMIFISEKAGSELCKHLEIALKIYWEDIGKAALIEANVVQPLANSAYFRQLAAHLQFHWLNVPFEEDNYRAAYINLERSFAGLKNNRQFNQFEEVGRKCSLDGTYNALFYSKESERKPRYIDERTFTPVQVKGLKPYEALSALTFVKRFHKTGENFPSTSRIALGEIFNKYPTDLKFYQKVLQQNAHRKSHVDVDQLLYKDNLTEKYLRSNKNPELADRLVAYQNRRNKIEEEATNSGLRWLKYYAIIKFDGDNIGEWLRGKYLQNPTTDLKQFHQYFSAFLYDFAQATRTIVEGDGQDKIERGSVIYAGGDDFLAMVSLPYLFDCLLELRTTFSDLFQKKFAEADAPLLEQDAKLTFSAGAVIAHYKEAMGGVAVKLNETLAKAKANLGKNALALAVLKRAGETVEAIFDWEHSLGINGVVQLKKINALLQKEHFSTNFISVLQQEFALVDAPTHALLKAEIDRTIKRSCSEPNKHKEEIVQLATEIAAVSKIDSGQNFFAALNICDFLKRKVTI